MALRVWKQVWQQRRTVITVRGDSVAMLTVVLKLKPTDAPSLGLIARELALDLAEATFAPEIRAHHLPGVANKLADVLSRRHMPCSSAWSVPSCLLNVPEASTPIRDETFYRTLV